VRGTQRKGFFTGNYFERYVRKALEMERLYGSSVRGTYRKGFFTGNYFEIYVRKALEMSVSMGVL